RVGRSFWLCCSSGSGGVLLPPTLERLGGGGLLGGLLAPPLAPADHERVDSPRHLEPSGVGRARLTGDVVGYAGALPRQLLLKGGLEVELGLRGELDLLGERGHRRLAGGLEPVMEVAGADHGL